ncbi:unnamed protein product [Brachionus calyciflorus]|uniref:Peptidase metallopeptidase domain-containing protein n=1 Tax=Brachionus calyciflorus TaxID=104777 RepID=A0A813UP04_9BILA|nr:unnamed protein product [Brachionus calyciflorus]
MLKFINLFLLICIKTSPIRSLLLPSDCEISLQKFNLNEYNLMNHSLSERNIFKYTIARCKDLKKLLILLENNPNFVFNNTLKGIELNFNDFNMTLNLSTRILDYLKQSKIRIDLLILTNLSWIYTTPEFVNTSLLSSAFINKVIIKDSNLKTENFEYFKICKLSFNNKYCGLEWLSIIQINHLYFLPSVYFDDINCLPCIFFTQINMIYFYNISSSAIRSCKFYINIYIHVNYRTPNIVFIDSNFNISTHFLSNFLYLNSLTIHNSDVILDDGLFRYFDSLFFIYLKLNDYKKFFKSTQNKWLLSYGSYKPIDFNDCFSITKKNGMNFIYEIEFDAYDFPNEDFCYFKDFPHQKLVFPVVKYNQNLKCTCTLIWLIQNLKLKSFIQSKNLDEITNSVIIKCLKNLDKINKGCDFNNRLKACGSSVKTVSTKCKFDKKYFSSDCLIKFFEMLVIFFLSSFGLCLGFYTYRLIYKANCKQNMFSYMKIDIFHQCVYFSLLFSNLIITSSIDGHNLRTGCSLDFRIKSELALKIKVYIFDFMLSLALNNSQVYNFILTLDRYLHISNRNKKTFNFLSLIILFSIVLNLNDKNEVCCLHLFQKLKDKFKKINGHFTHPTTTTTTTTTTTLSIPALKNIPVNSPSSFIKNQEFNPLNFLQKNGYGLGLATRNRVFVSEMKLQTTQVAENAEFKNMITLFQRLHNLNITGKLDNQTVAKMKSPSCANPDIQIHDENIIKKRRQMSKRSSNDLEFKWFNTNLTYKILNLDKSLNIYTYEAIQKAFQYWQEVTEFNFTLVKNLNQTTDFVIEFVPKVHNDEYPFDETVEELAHAFYPEDGRIHFFEKKLFTENSTDGYNLRIVAAHEIGHALGLGHSYEKGSLMNKYYPGFIPDFTLPEPDRKRIRSFYNLSERIPVTTQTTQITTKTTSTSTKTNQQSNATQFNYKIYDPCISEMDAIFYDPLMKYIYVIINNRKNRGILWRYELSKHKWDTIRLYETYQDILPSFRGGFRYKNLTWFIKSKTIWAYNQHRTLQSGYPKQIRDPLFPDNVYTGVNLDNDVYFLKGSFAYHLNLKTLRMEEPYPHFMNEILPGIPWWIETSLKYNNSIHFFKDNWVYKFDLKTKTVEHGFPKIKHKGWFACMPQIK